MFSMKKRKLFDGSDVCHLTVNCLIEKSYEHDKIPSALGQSQVRN